MERRRKSSAKVSRVASPTYGSKYRRAMREARRAYLIEVLRRNGGKVAAAAIEAGIGRPTMYTLMHALGIDWHNLPQLRPVYLREAPHCPTCACGLKAAVAIDRVNGSTGTGTHGY